MLYVNHIDLATKEDKENELDYWAQAFLAKTWDELKSLAEKAEVFREVAESMYTVNADVSQRSIAEAHRKYVETYTTLKNCLERAEKRADDAEAEVKRLREELAQLKAEKRDL